MKQYTHNILGSFLPSISTIFKQGSLLDKNLYQCLYNTEVQTKFSPKKY